MKIRIKLKYNYDDAIGTRSLHSVEPNWNANQLEVLLSFGLTN